MMRGDGAKMRVSGSRWVADGSDPKLSTIASYNPFMLEKMQWSE